MTDKDGGPEDRDIKDVKGNVKGKSCPTCDSSGVIYGNQRCPRCLGTGFIKPEVKKSVTELRTALPA